MCCAILFPAGPEAVQRQPSEDMKDFEFPDVLGFIQNQARDAPEYVLLAHNPYSYLTRCIIYIRYSISVESCG